MCFPVNLAKCLKTPFVTEHLHGWFYFLAVGESHDNRCSLIMEYFGFSSKIKYLFGSSHLRKCASCTTLKTSREIWLRKSLKNTCEVHFW